MLGICASGGCVPYAARTDHRKKAVATVSAADATAFLRDGDPAGSQRTVERAGRLRDEEAAGQPATLVSVLPDAVDDSTPPLVREFFDYYRAPRGHHPRSTNRWVMRGVDQLARYDSFADVDRIAPRPLLMIAGTEAETLSHSQRAIARAGEHAELFEVEGATHVDLYDREHYVTLVVARLTDFFSRYLAA